MLILSLRRRFHLRGVAGRMEELVYVHALNMKGT